MSASSGCPFHDPASAISAIVRRTWQVPKADGSRGRPLHDKTHACLQGEFRVLPVAEERFRHGLFAEPGRYPARARFSSSLFHDDRQHDLRGLAIKLHGVTGEVCEGAPPGQQDFVLLNQSFFGPKDAADALSLFSKLDGGGPITAAKLFVPDFIFPRFSLRGIRWYYLKWLLLTPWTHWRFRDLDRYVYHSVTPYRLGEEGIRYQVRPAAGVRRRSRGRTFRERLQSVLDQGPLIFDFLVQPREGDDEPLDDASVTWKLPGYRVAQLEIPPQDVAATVPEGDKIAFSPWNCLKAHSPLGSINAARRLAYRDSANDRGGDARFPTTPIMN
ncbi:MAG TPA: hypothetical protein VEB21_15380 [Terriglobales bacterium]|nr:hypothetical protein [Terriglobales bacterium]